MYVAVCSCMSTSTLSATSIQPHDWKFSFEALTEVLWNGCELKFMAHLRIATEIKWNINQSDWMIGKYSLSVPNWTSIWSCTILNRHISFLFWQLKPSSGILDWENAEVAFLSFSFPLWGGLSFFLSLLWGGLFLSLSISFSLMRRPPRNSTSRSRRAQELLLLWSASNILHRNPTDLDSIPELDSIQYLDSIRDLHSIRDLDSIWYWKS